ncbi:hypothetical protein [Kribbella sp. NPDC050459]|uniref:hypothetical protein n=1 Tax=Kribbella sp. NPDC050459 TaxID=3155785 RepID=UPI003406110C
MANEPTHRQTTVRQLMAALEQHQSDAVVIIELQPTTADLPPGTEELQIVCGVEIPQQSTTSPVFRLKLQDRPSPC